MMSTVGGVATSFTIQGSNPSPRGIAVGPDGNLWFTEYYDGYIGRITPNGVITRFSVSPNSSPWDIIAGPDGTCGSPSRSAISSVGSIRCT
jgi:streptogramin lyase